MAALFRFIAYICVKVARLFTRVWDAPQPARKYVRVNLDKYFTPEEMKLIISTIDKLPIDEYNEYFRGSPLPNKAQKFIMFSNIIQDWLHWTPVKGRRPEDMKAMLIKQFAGVYKEKNKNVDLFGCRIHEISPHNVGAVHKVIKGNADGSGDPNNDITIITESFLKDDEHKSGICRRKQTEIVSFKTHNLGDYMDMTTKEIRPRQRTIAFKERRIQLENNEFISQSEEIIFDI